MPSDGPFWRRGLAAAALSVALAAGPAAAATPLADVASALATDRLFIDPDVAGALSPDEADQLRERLGQAATPVYLAVLPDPDSGSHDTGSDDTSSDETSSHDTSSDDTSDDTTADSSEDDTDDRADLAGRLLAAAGRPGTYAVVVGTAFHAASDVIGTTAEELAADALDAVRSGTATATALLEFVDDVELAAGQAEAAADGSGNLAADDPRNPWPFPTPGPGAIAFGLIAGLVAFGVVRRR